MRTLVHVSDLHAGRLDPSVLRPLVTAIRGARPDLVVVSGDFTQRATIPQFEQARAFLEALERPTLAIPGNHDVPRARSRCTRSWSAWDRWHLLLSTAILLTPRAPRGRRGWAQWRRRGRSALRWGAQSQHPSARAGAGRRVHERRWRHSVSRGSAADARGRRAGGDQTPVIQRILRHLGLPTDVPEPRPARPPPCAVDPIEDQSPDAPESTPPGEAMASRWEGCQLGALPRFLDNRFSVPSSASLPTLEADDGLIRAVAGGRG
jgi:hypothetical protein